MALQTRMMRNSLVAAGLIGVISFAVFAQDMKPSHVKPAHVPAAVAVHVSSSVNETIGQLSKMLADNGMMVMGELHQGKVLSMTGLHVESESIFVGNPTVGKKLFSEDPGAGIAVPIRINVYKDTNGDTVVRYVRPTNQLAQFNNAKINMVAKMLDGKLNNLVSMLPK